MEYNIRAVRRIISRPYGNISQLSHQKGMPEWRSISQVSELLILRDSMSI